MASSLNHILSQHDVDRIQLLNQQAGNLKFCCGSPAFLRKVSLIALGALSTFSASVVSISFSFGFVAAPLAISSSTVMLVAGTIFFWLSTTVFDYNDPVQLQKLRDDLGKKAQDIYYAIDQKIFENYETLKPIGTSLLSSLAKTHGWKNIFYYGIILPPEFAKLFAVQLEFIDVKTWLSFYDQIATIYSKVREDGDVFEYSILDSSQWDGDLKEKIRIKLGHELNKYYNDETKQYDIQKIFKKYDFEKLCNLGLFTDDQAGHLRTFYQQYKDEKANLSQSDLFVEYQNSLNDLRKVKNSAVGQANAAFYNHPSHKALEKVIYSILAQVGDLRRTIASEEQKKYDEYAQFYNSVTNFTRLEFVDLEPDIQQEITRKQNQRDADILTIRSRYTHPITEIKLRYQANAQPLVNELKEAEREKNLVIARAKEQYRSQKQENSSRADDILCGNISEYEEKIATIQNGCSALFGAIFSAQ